MRSSWGKVVNMWWMIQLGKFQISSLLWWTAIVPCQEVAKEYNRPLKSNKNPLPSAGQIGFVWKKCVGTLLRNNPRCLILPKLNYVPSFHIIETPNTLGEVVNKRWFTSQRVNCFNRWKKRKAFRAKKPLGPPILKHPRIGWQPRATAKAASVKLGRFFQKSSEPREIFWDNIHETINCKCF